MKQQFKITLTCAIFLNLFWSSARAQVLMDEDISLKTRKETAAYMAALDVFTLEDIRYAIAGIWTHGLNPQNYWTGDMEQQYYEGEDAILKTPAKKGFLQLLKDISMGAINPENLTRDIKLKRKTFLSPKQLQAVIIATGQNAELLVNSMAPQNPPYVSLRATFQKVYAACQSKQWVSLGRPKKPLTLGVKDPSVVNLKKHLRFLGYVISSQDDIMDAETVNAINDIEWNMRMKPDGTLHPTGKVLKFLMTPCQNRVRQLQADLEKMRWFPQNFGDRYIFINLAMAYFVLMDKTQNPPYVMTFRTINGRPARKSPTMQDEVVEVKLNPFWVVPPTIFIEDKVQEIRNLPYWQVRYYFDSHNYEVWNHAFTKKIDPETIDWWSINSATDSMIYIRQKPHYWNALGVVKFELTNSFSIYLHDTGQRELFYEPQRLLSSGCIRLEKPLDVAEYLLQGTEWDRAKIEATVAKPGEVMTKDTPIKMKKPIPVYTVFLTTFYGSDGIIRFTEDSYGQNDDILKDLEAL